MSDLVIIDITENEKILLDGSSNLAQISGDGKLVVKNPSNKSRLWNLGCDLKEIVNTTLDSREINVGILNPSQEFNRAYEIENLKKSKLIVEEKFDAQRDITDNINNVFLYNVDNKCSISITLTNPLEIPISDIKVVREMPDLFKDIEIKNPTVGVAGLKEGIGIRNIEWDIVSLDGNQSVELVIFCNANVNSTDRKSLGKFHVTYLINNYQLTLLDPEIRGLTDSMSGIDRNEGSNPGSWDCEVEFINDSEFQVKLEDVKVVHKILTGPETVVSEKPNRLLNPEQSWSYDFKIESKDVPELSSSIEFTPLFVVITRVIGEINKESTFYPVLSATIEKAINPPEVDAYSNTDMNIENIITNNGSAKIDTIKLVDKIPPDFICPMINQIKINLMDMDISSRTEFTKRLELEPNDQNPETSHNIIIELFNLSESLAPMSKLTMSYPLLAKNPRPPSETLYKTPINIEVNSPIKGEFYNNRPIEEPEIKVKYVKRQLKTLKSIKPGLSEGEFSISVRIQNKGNVELENIIIKDKIPKDFELSEIEIESYEVIPTDNESELQVKLNVLKGNESFILNYTCSGQGEYPRYEPEVIVKGREAAIDSARISEPTHQSDQQIGLKVSDISLDKKAKINEIFNAIFKKIDQTVTGNELSDFIEGMKDEFPPGPVLHQFMQFAREIKSKAEDKIIVGFLRDELMEKLKDFKEIYQ